MSLKRMLAAGMISVFNLIDCIGAIPYHLSFYGWCAYHFTIGRLVFEFKLWQCNRRARKQQQMPSKTYYAAVGNQVWYAYIPGTAYKMGSPEYKAHLTGALSALSERLESEGKRIPAHMIADTIRKISKK